jgi:transposase-like protein
MTASRHRFRCRPLEDLARQLLFTPPEKRMDQVRRAEQLHDQIDPGRNYPFDFINYRITGYHSEADQADPTILVGDVIQPDLRLLIDAVSRSAGLPVTEAEPAWNVEDVARKLNVSTKTISRWRQAGLRWRWVIDPQTQRPRIGFTPDAVELFLSRHRQKVERAKRFSHIDAATRQELILRARRLAGATDVSLNQVARHLARRTGRALETLRQILEKHDEDHPLDPIFRDRSRPLTRRQKRAIARALRQGQTIKALALQYDRTRSTIRRAMLEWRAMVLRRLRIRYVMSPLFEREDADAVILSAEPELAPDAGSPSESPIDSRVPTDDLPQPLRQLYAQPALPAVAARRLLLQYNYLKFKADRMRAQLNPYEPRAGDLKRIESGIRQALQLRQRLVISHLRLVHSVARRQLIDRPEVSGAVIIDLLDVGNQVLIEAVEEFDMTRGVSFDSFLAWRLQRAFALQQTDAVRARRAHRRLSGDAILRRMQEAAGRAGVVLAVTGDRDEPGAMPADPG